MNRLEILLSLSSLSFQAALGGLVFARKAHRTFPLFSIFVYVVFVSSICVFASYLYFGFNQVSYYGFWASLFLFVATRSLAIAELSRYELHNYRGIWALVWRVLIVLSVFLIAEAAADAWGQPNGIAIYWASFARNFALASLVFLAALFLFRHYYGVYLEGFPKFIGLGIFFTCAVDAIGYAMFLSLLKGYLFPWFLESQKALWPAMEPVIRRVCDTWSAVHLVCFMIAIGIWCYALRKSLPAASKLPALLPPEVYWRVSPAVNMRLATFNERLAELLKP